jgi:hypothetical protein
VDLTPPQLHYLRDGSESKDREFQVNIHTNWGTKDNRDREFHLIIYTIRETDHDAGKTISSNKWYPYEMCHRGQTEHLQKMNNVE